MTLYATSMRRSELACLKVSDIDSQRMIIRVVEGKGGKDRDLPLSPVLLETLREYWRWRKPKLYMFPTRTHGQTLDQLNCGFPPSCDHDSPGQSPPPGGCSSVQHCIRRTMPSANAFQ